MNPTQPNYVKTLVRWVTGKRLTDRLPKLSLITLSLLNSGVYGLRVGPYVPSPNSEVLNNLWGARE